MGGEWHQSLQTLCKRQSHDLNAIRCGTAAGGGSSSLEALRAERLAREAAEKARQERLLGRWAAGGCTVGCTVCAPSWSSILLPPLRAPGTRLIWHTGRALQGRPAAGPGLQHRIRQRKSVAAGTRTAGQSAAAAAFVAAITRAAAGRSVCAPTASVKTLRCTSGRGCANVFCQVSIQAWSCCTGPHRANGKGCSCVMCESMHGWPHALHILASHDSHRPTTNAWLHLLFDGKCVDASSI
jgi:hypothetical protein